MPAFSSPEPDRHTPLGDALHACEIHCVSACCGMGAYDIAVEHLQGWANSVTPADLEGARNQAAEILEALKQAPERFYFLDTDHTRSEVTEWFKRVHFALAAVNRLDDPKDR